MRDDDSLDKSEEGNEGWLSWESIAQTFGSIKTGRARVRRIGLMLKGLQSQTYREMSQWFDGVKPFAAVISNTFCM